MSDRMYGWAGQRLHVHLSEGKIVKEELPEELRQEYLGGRGLNAKTLFDTVEPGIDALSPGNVLIVGAGPLVGTLAPCSARWTVTTKSPLTGAFGDGNAGGDFAPELKFAGYDQVIFYGRSPNPVYLWINNGHVELRDASHLWGKTISETHRLLVKELHDREIREISIGPGGENLVRFAKVYGNIAKTAGRGGMGTVMGSKNLKAVVVRGTGPVKIAKPHEFFNAAKQAIQKILASPGTSQLSQIGTLASVRAAQMAGTLGTRNNQAGSFEEFENLTAEAFMAQYAVKHKACFSCPIHCTHSYEVKEGPYAVRGVGIEYGAITCLGSRIGNSNLAAVLLATKMCNEFGIDTTSCGGSISFAMEAWQRGLLSAKDTDGLDLSWGNMDTVLQLVRKIAYREGFGNILAEGSERASRQIKGSDICLLTIKGVEFGAYPAEGSDKCAVFPYAVSTRGGDHLRGMLNNLAGHPKLAEKLGEEMAKSTEDPNAYFGKGALLCLVNNFRAATASLGICFFATGKARAGESTPSLLDFDDLARLFSTASGVELDGDGLLKVGERVYNVEQAFNVREGLGRKDDTLAEKYFREGLVDQSIFQAWLDEYYACRGWDANGTPTKGKLDELNLGYIAQQLGQA